MFIRRIIPIFTFLILLIWFYEYQYRMYIPRDVAKRLGDIGTYVRSGFESPALRRDRDALLQSLITSKMYPRRGSSRAALDNDILRLWSSHSIGWERSAEIEWGSWILTSPSIADRWRHPERMLRKGRVEGWSGQLALTGWNEKWSS